MFRVIPIRITPLHLAIFFHGLRQQNPQRLAAGFVAGMRREKRKQARVILTLGGPVPDAHRRPRIVAGFGHVHEAHRVRLRLIGPRILGQDQALVDQKTGAQGEGQVVVPLASA